MEEHLQVSAWKSFLSIALCGWSAFASQAQDSPLQGQIFVTNDGDNTVGQYTTSGATNNPSLIRTGSAQPYGIAVFGTNLFVVKNNNTIGEYTTAGVTIKEPLISGLNGPIGIAVSGTNLFVANSYGNTIDKYTLSGAPVNVPLITGLLNPQFIAVSGTNLFVSDAGNNRVGAYTTSGAIVNASLISGLNSPIGIAVSGTNLFVVEAGNSRIGEYTASGATVNASLVSGLNGPRGIAISGSILFVVNFTDGTIGEYTTAGVLLNASLIAGLNSPYGIAVQDDRYLVTNTNDSGPGSLRAAIENANGDPGMQTISFAIPGAGPRTIRPLSPLPEILDPVIIDGYTQPGANVNTLAEGDNAVLQIELAGSAVKGAEPTAKNGLVIKTGGSKIRGLVIYGFASRGIRLDPPGGNFIEGNFIGTDARGIAAAGNLDHGILVNESSFNTIGGISPESRNIIGANAKAGINVNGDNNFIQGNYIGTGRNGTTYLPNSEDGIYIPSHGGNTIGGTTAQARNVISGNYGYGIHVFNAVGAANVIKGNFIGTDATGKVRLGNTKSGIRVDKSANTSIGGSVIGAGNLISGNGADGVLITDTSTTATLVQGNLIGTDASGTQALDNLVYGVHISGATSNTIGGTVVGARNIISGNSSDGVVITDGATGNLVEGNFIGTKVNGSERLGNRVAGVSLQNGATGNTIGGTNPNARNVISGNARNAIYIYPQSDGNLIQGNLIGTDSEGKAPIEQFGLPGILIQSQNNMIGGTSIGAGNLISGNTRGIDLHGPEAIGNIVQGNFIGTDITGTSAVGNVVAGIVVENARNNIIGGTAAGAGNVISGNQSSGILIHSVGVPPSSTSGNLVQGNLIGTDYLGTGNIGNSPLGGIWIVAASGNTIGGMANAGGNVIAWNGGAGIFIQGDGAITNRIQRNSLFANTRLGIDLEDRIQLYAPNPNDLGDGDLGPNQLQNYPILSLAVRTDSSTLVQGSLNSSPNATFTIEFFDNASLDPSGFGEGESFLDAIEVMTDQSGNTRFSHSFSKPLDVGRFITATATDSQGNTSEFSNGVPVNLPPQPPVFTQQPVAVSTNIGSRVKFEMVLGGTEPLQYQWRLNGQNIPGATNSAYQIDSVQLTNAGSYTVVVANEAGQIISEAARLEITGIQTLQGADKFSDRVPLTGRIGTVSGNNFQATDEYGAGEPKHAGKFGGRSVWYRWTPDANGIATFSTSGSDFDTLLAVYNSPNLSALQGAVVASDEDRGEFLTSRVEFNALAALEYQIAIDGLGLSTGKYVLHWELKAGPQILPVIKEQPTSRTVRPGEALTLSVRAEPSGVTYHWLHEGRPIPGATQPDLKLANVQSADVGTYHVEVSNGSQLVMSEHVVVEIGPQSDVQTTGKHRDFLSSSSPGLVKLSGVGGPPSILSVSAGLPGLGQQFTLNTSEQFQTDCGHIGGSAKWIRLRPLSDGVLVLDTIGSTFDTVLVLTKPFIETPQPGTIFCDDNNAPNNTDSVLVLTVKKSRVDEDVLWIYVDKKQNAGGSNLAHLNWQLIAGADPNSIQGYLTRVSARQFTIQGTAQQYFMLQARDSFLAPVGQVPAWQSWKTLRSILATERLSVNPSEENQRFFRVVPLPSAPQ